MRNSMHSGCVTRSISKWLIVGLILCFVAVMAITGITFSIDNVTYGADVDTESIGDDTATTAATGDTFTTGLPNGTIYAYTDFEKGKALSEGGTGDDKTPVTVVNPSNRADGSQANPYVISTKADWTAFVSYIYSDTVTTPYGAGEYFVLNADLDYTNTSGGKDTIEVLYRFGGTLYGNNHSIINANIGKNPDTNDNFTLGLICYAREGLYVADLSLKDFNMTTSAYHISPLLGEARKVKVTITNCYTQGAVEQKITSGYGSPAEGTTTNYGYYYQYGGIIGSIAGTNAYANIYKCATACILDSSTTLTGTQFTMQGGLVGAIDSYDYGSSPSAEIYNCFSSFVSNVSGAAMVVSGNYIGYQRGSSSIIIKGCVAIANNTFSGSPQYGALFYNGGTPSTLIVHNCYFYTSLKQGTTNLGAQTTSSSGTISNTYHYCETGTATSQGINNVTVPTNLTEFWNAAKTGLSSQIWIIPNVTAINSTIDNGSNPIDIFATPVFVNKTKISFVDYKGNAMTLQDGETGNEREYEVTDIGSDLPTPDAPGGDTLNYTFLGWTTNKESTTKLYTSFEGGLYGNVTMYSVWEMKNISVTVEGSNRESFPFTDTYTGDTLVTLTGMPNAPSTDYNVSYEWFKGTTPVKIANLLPLSLVSESGQYKVKCTITDKDNPLWIGTAESTPVTVTINKCTPVLITDTFGIDSTKDPYVNRPLSELTISSTTQAGATATSTTPIPGKFSWSSSIAKVQSGTNNVKIKFEPDDKDNYVSPVLLDVTFESVPLLLTFDMQEAISQTLTYEMEYNNEYDTAKIAAEFLTLFTKACTDHPAEYADASTMTPVLDGREINQYKTWNYKYKATAAKTIKVTFKEKKYKVTYEFNDGGTTANKEIECNYNQFISKENLNWEGHELEGWYVVVDKSMTNTKWDFINDRVTDDLTLRAKWVTVTLELESIELKLKKTTFTALEKVTEADITVIGHFMRTDDNSKKSEKEIAFDDFDITYEGRDGKLHVQKPGFTVSYTYDGVTKEASPDPAVKVNPVKIDVSGIKLNDKSVVYTGTAQSIDKIAPEALSEFIGKITDVTYEYIYNGNTVPESDVKELGDYTVIATFVVTNPDYVADPETLSATLSITREKTKLTVEWDTTSLEYNGSAQHPTPIFKRADGTVANVSYNLTGDTDATDIGSSYTVTAALTTNGFVIEGDASVTFAITKAKLDAPTLKDEPIIYNGNTIYLAEFLNGYDAAIMEITGDASKTDVSNVGYTAYIGLTNDNYEWKSGNNTETVNWAFCTVTHKIFTAGLFDRIASTGNREFKINNNAFI